MKHGWLCNTSVAPSSLTGSCHMTVERVTWKLCASASARERQEGDWWCVMWCCFSPAAKNTARCTICEKEVSQSSKKSNLFKHLKTARPESNEEGEQKEEGAPKTKVICQRLCWFYSHFFHNVKLLFRGASRDDDSKPGARLDEPNHPRSQAIWIHPLGNMNVCANFRWTDRQTRLKKDT